ncbi:MAG: hypothetical protein AAGK66_02700 [Pseudomonadota bacterium]
MTEPAIHTLLDAICADFLESMPELRDCKPHGGDFTADEVKRFSINAPSIRVACLAMSDPKKVSGGFVDYTLKLTAVISAKQTADLDRHAAATAIVNRVLIDIADATWGLDIWVHPAKLPEARSLYAGAIDRQGLALWQVRWNQCVRLTVPDDPEPLDPAVYIGFAPDIGPDHIDDYERIGDAA